MAVTTCVSSSNKPTIHHRTQRDTSKIISGCLQKQAFEYVTRIGVINKSGNLVTLEDSKEPEKTKGFMSKINELIMKPENVETAVEINNHTGKGKGGLKGLKKILSSESNRKCSCSEDKQKDLNSFTEARKQTMQMIEDLMGHTSISEKHPTLEHPIHRLIDEDIERANADKRIDKKEKDTGRILCSVCSSTVTVFVLVTVVAVLTVCVSAKSFKF